MHPRLVVLSAVVLLATAALAAEPAPLLVTHQGYLLDNSEKPVTAQLEVKFGIYDDPDVSDAPTPLWSEKYAISVNDGRFAAVLGDQAPPNNTKQPLPASTFSGRRWLGITIGTGTELTPRLAISSVPYAGRAAIAATVETASIGTAALADGAVTLPKLALTDGKLVGLDADKLDGKDSTAFAAAAELETVKTNLTTLTQTAGGAGAAISGLAAAGTVNAEGNPVDWTKLKNVPADIVDGDQGASAAAGGGLSEAGGAFSIASDAASLSKVTAGAMAAVGGNIGVGTSSPTARLTIGGGNVVIDANAGSLLLNSSTAKLSLGANQIGTTTTHDFFLRTNSLDRLTILANGNVGIGTTNPLAALDVAGTGGIRLPTGTIAQRPTGSTAGIIRFNSETKKLEYSDGALWWGLGGSLTATGGIVTEAGGYRIHTFLSSGTFDVTSGGKVDFLIVAGGGAGGGRHGGGGGGVLYVTNATISEGVYPIVVGAGAPTNVGCTNAAGANGGNSSAFGEVAKGGGGGGAYSGVNGVAGGSGGGAGHSPTNGGAGTQTGPVAYSGTGYGNAGANNPGGGNEASGGGGAGGSGQQSVGETYGGAGGPGIQINIDGNNYYWAGGGGGGLWANAGASAGAGGLGGGGGGGVGNAGNGGAGGQGGRNVGTAGANGGTNNAHGGAAGANTGGGGGGSGQCGNGAGDVGNGGAGGSGIVIIRTPK